MHQDESNGGGGVDGGSQPQSQSQSASANTLCSMETLDVSDTAVYSEEDDNASQQEKKDPAWGRLLPVGADFAAVDLCKLCYVFGRGDNCDVSFHDPKSRNQSKYLVYSKVHFVLKRENTAKGCHTCLEDTSSNGTFVNGTKLGKTKKQVLNNNDEIALATSQNRAYVYLDLNAKEDEQFPEEVRSRYTVSREIGRGACGEVRLGFEKGTCKKCAIKIISKKTFSMGGRTPALNLSSSHLMNEVTILRALKHPCIVDIEDVIDTTDTLFIFLELIEGGDLFNRVKSTNGIDEPDAKLLFYQLVISIQYLHQKGITHRDLKLENVLLATDDTETLIKVTDFGLSKFMDANSLMKTFCGTPNYLAPEVLKTAGSGSYTQAVDCWSLGVILFMCLSGYPPFSEEYTDLPLPQQIIKGRVTFPRDAWSVISNEAIDLIKRFLTVDPMKRFTTDDALNHPWLKDDEMISKARKLMFPTSANGVVENRTKRKLKRQHEESSETLDGDSDGDSTSTTPSKKTATEATDDSNS